MVSVQMYTIDQLVRVKISDTEFIISHYSDCDGRRCTTRCAVFKKQITAQQHFRVARYDGNYYALKLADGSWFWVHESFIIPISNIELLAIEA